jgi:endonuclease/exonuclease/phosphatase family metal-dependent hydrolase
MKVLSFNTWGVPYLLKERTKIAIDQIIPIAADVIAFQEVASPFARHEYRRRLGNNYHIVSSDHEDLQYPWMAYVPSMIAMMTALLLYVPTTQLLRWSVIAGLVSMFALPQNISMIIIKSMHYPGITGISKFDFMGSMVLARKKKFDSLEVVRTTPFPLALRGYPTGNIPVWWFQTCFLRPNFMIVRCMDRSRPSRTKLIVVNVHLVVGRHNRSREAQLLHIFAAVQTARTQFNCSNILICGDFNAHHDEPELKLMGRYGFYDSVDDRKIDIKDICTWDPQNTNNQNRGQRHRIDYIFHSSTFNMITFQRCCDDFPYASDHYGVVKRLVLKTKAANVQYNQVTKCNRRQIFLKEKKNFKKKIHKKIHKNANISRNQHTGHRIPVA